MIAGKQIKEINVGIIKYLNNCFKAKRKKEKKGYRQIENKDQTKHIIILSMYSLNTSIKRKRDFHIKYKIKTQVCPA